MAINVPTADIVADYVLSPFAANGDGLLVLQGIDIVARVGAALSSAPTVLQTRTWVEGTLFSGNWGQGIYLNGQDKIEIGPTGRVILASRIEYAGFDLGNEAGGTYVTNRGAISVGNATAISFERGDNRLINYGSIDAGSNGVTLGLNGGNRDILVNHGTIATTGVDGFGFYYGNGVLIDGNNARVLNTGTISTAGDGNSGIRIGSAASGGDNTVIVNEGGIFSSRGSGILSQLPPDSTGLIITNSGTIQGLINAVQLSAGADIVTNTGTLIGDVFLGAGGDRFDGRGGTVIGRVLGQDGDDVYYVSGAGYDILEVGSGGYDRVYAWTSYALGDEIERLDLMGAGDLDGTGNALANVIRGTAGANRLDGLQGNDSLEGLEGDDILLGRGGNDTLTGGTGDDRLHAGADNDRVVAGDGDDLVVGGLGRDILFGGADADVFAFASVAESEPTANRDVIQDFEQGLDLIDLSVIDAVAGTPANEAFAFTGAAGFNGTAGQVRYVVSGGDTIVTVHTDADASPDMQIRLTGTFTLTAADFIL